MSGEAIYTLRDIAKALGVADRGTVVSYARRPFDPLRLRIWIDEYWIRQSVLDAWKARQLNDADLPRRVGLHRIGDRIRRTPKNVKALASRTVDPIPVYGIGKRNPWCYESALDDWIDAQDRPFGLNAETVDPAQFPGVVMLSGKRASVAMSNPARFPGAIRSR